MKKTLTSELNPIGGTRLAAVVNANTSSSVIVLLQSSFISKLPIQKFMQIHLSLIFGLHVTTGIKKLCFAASRKCIQCAGRIWCKCFHIKSESIHSMQFHSLIIPAPFSIINWCHNCRVASSFLLLLASSPEKWMSLQRASIRLTVNGLLSCPETNKHQNCSGYFLTNESISNS